MEKKKIVRLKTDGKNIAKRQVEKEMWGRRQMRGERTTVDIKPVTGEIWFTQKFT